MKIKRCPEKGPGYRNIFCPLYGNCLDSAIQRNWVTWNCSLCPVKTFKRPVHDYEFATGLSAFAHERNAEL